MDGIKLRQKDIELHPKIGLDKYEIDIADKLLGYILVQKDEFGSKLIKQ